MGSEPRLRYSAFPPISPGQAIASHHLTLIFGPKRMDPSGLFDSGVAKV